jgi:endonuclease/exonuclease/phosphatase family metal-dependent hydrolase
LEDRAATGRFRVYNRHLQLSPIAQPQAAKVMKAKLQGLEVPAIIMGDFNAPHGWPALQVLEGAGFSNAETSGALTYHVRGKGIRCLDHILTDSHRHVAEGGVLKDKGGKAYPTDHYGLWAALALRR